MGGGKDGERRGRKRGERRRKRGGREDGRWERELKKKKKEWQIQEVVSYGSMCNAVAFLDGTKVDLFVPDVDILDGLSPYPDSYRSVVFLVIFFCFLFFLVFFETTCCLFSSVHSDRMLIDRIYVRDSIKCRYYYHWRTREPGIGK